MISEVPLMSSSEIAVENTRHTFNQVIQPILKFADPPNRVEIKYSEFPDCNGSQNEPLTHIVLLIE